MEDLPAGHNRLSVGGRLKTAFLVSDGLLVQTEIAFRRPYSSQPPS
ncbi:hypothetical protein HMPREF9120_02673 [Neisseria sp. oral taxon 020 str. F0370]|nr:hypothetical protein HMPREF9120_02673 [Neisseria sp. oral taxon 020 str. F0370]